jgi:purine catabolism regulator
LLDPTEWLDSGELLMTTGLGVPKEPASQKAYVERLADAGLSALAIGHGMTTTPKLSPEMIKAADERALPLLFTSYEVPFTAIARAVADANQGEERQRLAQAQQIYEMVRLTSGSVSSAELIARLGGIVGCQLYVLDPDRGFSLFPDNPKIPEEVIAALKEAKKERMEPMPAMLRMQAGSHSMLALAVPASRPTTMVALPHSDKAKPDLSVMRHITAVAALEIEKQKVERERRRRLGSELLAGIIDGRISAESAVQMLSEQGLGKEPRVIALCAIDEGEAEHSDLHHRLEDRCIPHLLLRRAPLLIALLPDAPEALAGFREEIDPAFTIGLSDPLSRVSRIPEARREAQWALEGTQAIGAPFVRYGEDAPSPFLPRGLGEAERIVRHVLGPILDYDAAHNARLVESLRVFLEHNRSWQRAAMALHVHKQTLVYRMRRVEELSSRKLDQTEDVAELWLALRAAEASGLWSRPSKDRSLSAEATRPAT